MADDKKKKSNSEIDYLNNETNMTIYADHYGLTPQFIKDNKDKLNDIEKRVKKSLNLTSSTDDDKSIFNTMDTMQKIIQKTYISDSFDNNLNVSHASPYTSFTTRDGMRMVYGDAENYEDNLLFSYHSSLFSNYRNLVSEYRNISRLINEVDRCADMKSRDILAINEITKRAISNVYQPDSLDKNQNLPENLIKDPVNKAIQEEILDRYEIEDKLPRYIKLSLIEGARPVVIFPFKDIIDMAEYNINLYRKNYGDFNLNEQKAERSGENYQEFLSKYCEKSHKIIPPQFYDNFTVFGTEDVHKDKDEAYKSKRDAIINRYVSQEEFREYFDRGCEDVHTALDKEEHNRIVEIYGKNAMNTSDLIDTTKKEFEELHAKVKVDGSLSDHFKDQIFNAIKRLDDNIEFYDEGESSMAFAINNFRRLMQFTGYKEDPQMGLVAYGAVQQPSEKQRAKNPFFDQDNPDYKKGMAKATKPKSILDDFDDFDENSRTVMNDCLIKEYDAEDVIPVIVSGRHVGYYLIEMSPYTGNVESINKRNCNFTDMFLNLGMGNDTPLSPSPAVSGSFSSGVTSMPLGGTGPASEIGGLGVIGAGSTALAGGMDISGFETGLIGEDALRRNNIMKKIIFNVLKDKLNRKDLGDDESFADTIMSLIRDGAIIQNKVKIVYIPEKYMCYFTPGLDGNGIPQSFLKNCLFTCYEKILVNMNNVMTRITRTSTRDKISVNIGKAKNMGASIRSIENALTTRRLNVESPFTSLSRVLKTASLSETIIVPVFDGDPLFEYEDLTRTNEPQSQDDYEEKLSNQIVTALKCPVTITNPYQEEDFASLAASRNAEYRFDIIRHQKVFTKTIEKMIKLLFVGSGLFDELKKGTKNLSLKNIHINLAAPESLNMQHANEMFSTVSSYVENIVGVIINPDDSSETTNMQRWLFKQKLYQRFMPGIDFETFLNDASDLLDEARTKTVRQKQDDSINNELVNTTFEPVQLDEEGDAITRDDSNKDVGMGNGDGGSNDDDFSNW